MIQKIHLWMEDIIETNEILTIQAKIEYSPLKKEHLSLWFRLPGEYRSDSV